MSVCIPSSRPSSGSVPHTVVLQSKGPLDPLLHPGSVEMVWATSLNFSDNGGDTFPVVSWLNKTPYQALNI